MGLHPCKKIRFIWYKLYPRNLTRPQDVFNGTWNEVSKTNIEEFLKKVGYNWVARKVGNLIGMTLVLKGLSLFHYYNVLTLIGKPWKKGKKHGTVTKRVFRKKSISKTKLDSSYSSWDPRLDLDIFDHLVDDDMYISTH